MHLKGILSPGHSFLGLWVRNNCVWQKYKSIMAIIWKRKKINTFLKRLVLQREKARESKNKVREWIKCVFKYLLSCAIEIWCRYKVKRVIGSSKMWGKLKSWLRLAIKQAEIWHFLTLRRQKNSSSKCKPGNKCRPHLHELCTPCANPLRIFKRVTILNKNQ